jgi:hypothetical protein
VSAGDAVSLILTETSAALLWPEPSMPNLPSMNVVRSAVRTIQLTPAAAAVAVATLAARGSSAVSRNSTLVFMRTASDRASWTPDMNASAAERSLTLRR